jgi:hypothetical protein
VEKKMKNPMSPRRLLLQTTALVALTSLSGPVFAQDCDNVTVPVPVDCERNNANIVVEMPLGANTEREDTLPMGGFATTGFSISIEDETIAGAPAPREPQRRADVAAALIDVDVRYDGLNVRPLLNVATADLRGTFRAGETVTFRSSANYPAWIARSEIRIIDRALRGDTNVTTIPTNVNSTVSWTMPETGSGDFTYVLRVYDAQGRFDETQPIVLSRSTEAFATHDTVGLPLIAAGEGEDRARLRNIPVIGGMVTASGQAGRPGGVVTVMGENVPVDAQGRFVVTRILPPGDQIVTVNASGRQIIRDVQVPDQEWFYVAIADVTYGVRLQDELYETSPDYEETYLNGRLGYYVKGRTASGYTITSSVDTGNGPLDQAFERLGEKDPRSFLRRLDPEDLYPTYGDDSTSFDDTPSQGRFYLRAENDTSRVTWGDFTAGVTSHRLLSNTRTLYGLEAAARTRSVTTNGDAVAGAVLYAAQPDTLAQRDILRGTGGSVYFLQRQDIEGGTAVMTLRVSDPDTGRVIDTVTLQEGVDYDVDYIQGVVILAQPLASTAAGNDLITTGSGAYDVDLIAQYEYTPNGASLDGAALGGRAEAWVTDNMRLGITAMRETTGIADQRMASIDARANMGANSFVSAELAQTQGQGFGRAISTDGGLTIDADGGVDGVRATAVRLDTHLDLTDFGGTEPGHVDIYFERKDAGFSTLSDDITEDQTLVGIDSAVTVSPRVTLGLGAESFEKDGGDRKNSAELRGTYTINDNWSVTAALAHEDLITAGTPDKTGARTDLGLRVDYTRNADQSLYVFGQGTLRREGGLDNNNRIGLGGASRLSETLSATGEISDGDGGMGAGLRLTYAATPDNETYLGYTLDPTRGGAGSDLVGRDDGTFVLGGNYRMNDQLRFYTQSNLDLFGQKQSLTRAFGVTYTPTAAWAVSGSTENGRVRDTINGDFDRFAVSLGAAYTNADLNIGRARLEYRSENGAGITQDRETWALTTGYEHKANDDWRVLASVDALYSQSDEDAFRDGEYLEASIGYAYRPIDNERLNLLLKYTHLHDLPGEDQVNAAGDSEGPSQRSHVFSVDGTYDLSTTLTFGAKYGYRKSEVAARGTDEFTASTASLAIARLDWHVVHKWDVFGELRAAMTHEIDVTETGALLGVYRHIGNNAKIGVGYEWGRVSDDITNLDYDGQGVFLNLVAKF